MIFNSHKKNVKKFEELLSRSSNNGKCRGYATKEGVFVEYRGRCAKLVGDALEWRDFGQIRRAGTISAFKYIVDELEKDYNGEGAEND